MDTNVNFEGYLEKTASGIFKNVSRVWMVLNNLTLEYYKDNLKSDCIGSIHVHNIQIVRLTREKEGTEFQIITKDKLFKFVAESEELATAWVKVIQTTMNNKTPHRQSSPSSPVRHEIIQVIPKPTSIFGVTLKPTHASRVSEHDEEASSSKQEQSEQHKLNDSTILPDLPNIKEEQTSLFVNDHTITANTITSPFNNHETTLSYCKLDENRHDLKGDEIPNNLLEVPTINSTPNDTDVHLKDETNVYRNSEHSTINNCTYENVDISKVQMRNSKRFSAAESRRCKVDDLSNIGNNNTSGVKYRKLSKHLSTADAPVDIFKSQNNAHHTNYESREIFNSEEDDICPDISPSTHTCLPQTFTFDDDFDSINSVPKAETDANDFTNASLIAISFTSFHRLRQYFMAMLPEEFDIECHRVCSKNPVENLQSLLDYTYRT